MITFWYSHQTLIRRGLGYIWTAREAAAWIVGLFLLALMNPGNEHGSLCPLAATGITWCPGCGLGHSIAWLFRGDVVRSVQAHWLGIPALVIIGYRILQIIRNTNKHYHHGTSDPIHS